MRCLARRTRAAQFSTSTSSTARTRARSPRSSGSNRETGQFRELLRIYEKKRDLSTDAGERKAILYAIAQLQEKEMKDAASATATYVQVLEDDALDATGARCARSPVPRSAAVGALRRQSCARASTWICRRPSSSI